MLRRFWSIASTHRTSKITLVPYGKLITTSPLSLSSKSSSLPILTLRSQLLSIFLKMISSEAIWLVHPLSINQSFANLFFDAEYVAVNTCYPWIWSLLAVSVHILLPFLFAYLLHVSQLFAWYAFYIWFEPKIFLKVSFSLAARAWTIFLFPPSCINFYFIFVQPFLLLCF